MVLDDSALTAAQQKLADLRFTTTSFVTTGVAAAAIAKFVRARKFVPEFVLDSTMAMAIPKPPGPSVPGPSMDYVEQIELGMIKDETDCSCFINVGIFEMLAACAPRILPASRYASSSHRMQSVGTM